MTDPHHNHGFISIDGALLTESPLSVMYKDMNGRLPRTPHGEVMLNGGTMRGPLRKAAVRVVRRLTAEHLGVPEKGLFALSDEYMLGSGYDRTREVNNEKTKGADPIGDALLRDVNPLLSLFGRWGLPGYLETSEMRTSATNLMVAGQGVRADQYERDPHLVTYLTEADQQALEKEMAHNRELQVEINAADEELAALKRKWAKASSAKEKADLQKQMNAQEKVIDTLKKSRDGGEHAIKHPLSGYESIAPGASLSSSFSLIQGRDVYLGLFLHIMNEFARHPQLGGHAAIGFGKVSGEYTVKSWPPGAMRPQEIGSVSFGREGFSLAGPVLEAAYSALPDAVKGCHFNIWTLKALREHESAMSKDPKEA